MTAKTTNSIGLNRLDCQGQATVEFVLIGLVFLAVLVGLATLRRKIGEGLFIEHVVRCISHGIGPDIGGVIGDVLLY